MTPRISALVSASLEVTADGVESDAEGYAIQSLADAVADLGVSNVLRQIALAALGVDDMAQDFAVDAAASAELRAFAAKLESIAEGLDA